ncbi:patatin-like phospholipase family protein [Parvularcula marina]|uniref:Patatin-like phospholipase family protein n=1 Tax=Parvularcula marina TaxID=2292771 RepID=A0A371RHA8_9PROT|nr:patatin-like phospholipase family protein [Parvularcula marina]RFB04833.1 patatin-like phospholipase family protein [Parvularcula marina]
MGTTRKSLFGRMGAMAGLGLALSGCVAFMPDRIHYVWEPDETAAPTTEIVSHDQFVGLAFSGGGSRAAYFAAAGAEALNEAGLLEEVTHISSVSGGSMAASYLATRPPEACGPRDVPCTRAYFDAYKATMRENYFWPMEWGQITKPNRFLSPTRRISSLQNAFDTKYLDEKTFGDLPSSRVLLINAASYDDGRRFVFSNRPIANGGQTDLPLSKDTLRSRNFSTSACAYPTPDDFPIALAVASSAAFPPALGPVAIEVPPACGETQTQYWHLGDGGILENKGVETLQEILLLNTQTPAPPKRAVIFSFDAGKQDSLERNLANRDLRLWTSDPGRVVSITNQRADAYWQIVWEQAKARLDIPVTIINIRYTDHIPTEWPESCKGRIRKGSIEDALNAVPTRFSITPCDAGLIEASARLGVARAVAEHRDTLVELK